jgi:hypothetical protein
VLEVIEETVNLHSLPEELQQAVYHTFKETVDHIVAEGKPRLQFWETKCYGVSMEAPRETHEEEKKNDKKETTRSRKKANTRKTRKKGE